VATRLTEALFRTMRPGGLLLVTNFVHGIRDVGYLEAFMDWWLLYRDDEEMDRLLSAIPEAEIARSSHYRERHGNITFLEVTRR
jgi:hypothetical protein